MTEAKKPTVYIVDASSLIYLGQTHNNVLPIPENIWAKLNEMLEDGSITSVRCVWHEVVTDAKKPDVISKWLKPKKLMFHLPTNQQVIYMSEAVQGFKGLVNPEYEKEQADPWLIAYAREKSELDPDTDYCIVTQENPNSPIKIPAAAKHFGIRTINLREFFDENNITFGS